MEKQKFRAYAEFKLICLMVLAMSIGSACAQETLSGRLVYTAGGKYVKVIDLASQQSSSLYEHPQTVLIQHVTQSAADRILFDECPFTEACSLKELNLKSGQAKTLRVGQLPTYLVGTELVFFYGSADGKLDNTLFLAKMSALDAPLKIANAPAPKELPNGILLPLVTPVVPISSNEVVFLGEDQQLWIYRIAEAVLFPIGIRECRPQGWRSRTQQLLCYDWNTWEAYAIDLNTKRRERLPIPERSHGLFYISALDLLIYGKTRLYFFISETSDIFAYSFHSRRQITLQKHAHLASGVWLEPLK
jgi:hypothetical protein